MNQLSIISIKLPEIELLKEFLSALGNSMKNFRYFENRNFYALKKHLCTFLILEEGKPVCYGHLDKEYETVWLGIAVIDEKIGKGLGKIMMEKLISEAMSIKVNQIFLSVDNDNIKAINLYKKYGFNLIEKTPVISKFILNIEKKNNELYF